MRLDLVTQRKQEYVEWSKGFRAWVSKQRELQSRDQRIKLAKAVQDAVAEGFSVAEVMRAYGTTDRKTINSLLDMPLTTTQSEEHSVYEFTIHNSSLFSVLEQTSREELFFSVDDTPMGWYPFVEGEEATTPLGVALNDPNSVLHKEAKNWLEEVL